MTTQELKKEKTKKWLHFVKTKNSLLVAGLDPAEFILGRADKGLPESINTATELYKWIDSYLGAIEPFCPGLKVNMKFFQESWKMLVLEQIMEKWRDKFFIIADSKLADLDSSNEAELLSLARAGFDCVTAAPYAGNLKGIIDDAAKHGLGVISMCLMSAPTYATTKNSLVEIPVSDFAFYSSMIVKDILTMESLTEPTRPTVPKYIYDAYSIAKYLGLGAVIGAPSEKNGLSMEEINNALYHLKVFYCESLILIPGWGAQGGDVEFVHKVGNYAMINQSRELMFPKGSSSTPADQRQAAEKFAKKTAKFIKN